MSSITENSIVYFKDDQSKHPYLVHQALDDKVSLGLRDYTPRQLEVIDFLEKLVHNRFSMDTLQTKLSEHFKEDIKVENVSQSRIDSGEEDELVDWNLMFTSEKNETYGYFDIYMLPMRREGFDGSTMYITEVAYEFE